VSRELRIAVYHNLHSGGAKRTLYETIKRLGQLHQLDVYTLSCADSRFCDVTPFARNTFVYTFVPLPAFHSPFGRLNSASRLVDLRRLERVQRRVAEDIDGRGYDVVLVQPCQFTQAPILLSLIQTPSVYYSQEPLRAAYEPIIERSYGTQRGKTVLLNRLDFLAAAYRLQRRRLDRRALLRASSVVTNSYFTREALYRVYGVSAHVCYHGVDSEVFRPLGLPRDQRMLSVGALKPDKGFDFLIESLGRIPNQMRPPLTIVSNYREPNELVYLKELARRHCVSVEFRMMISNEDLIRGYNTASLVLYAPIMEPFGLVPLEAMACGTPVVAVREGGMRESVLDGRTGSLVDRDPELFARAVKKLVGDTSLARCLGQQAREYVVAEWSWERAVRRLETHLRRTAEGVKADK